MQLAGDAALLLLARRCAHRSHLVELAFGAPQRLLRAHALGHVADDDGVILARVERKLGNGSLDRELLAAAA